jgi:exocyst complex component 4
MDSLLVSLAPRIKGPVTPPGIAKMLRNLLALQQNLRNLGDVPLGVDFRSRRFWDLVRLGDPDALIAAVDGTFTFEEYEVALALVCGVEPTVARNGASLPPETPGTGGQRRRLYNEALIGLHAAMAAF